MKFLKAVFFVLMTFVLIAGCSDDDVADPDGLAPSVSSTIPADAAVGVPINASLTATFSEAMDPATITATTFTLKQGSTAVTAAVTYTGTIATLNPTGNLEPETVYTATISVGAKDLSGKPLETAKIWSFTTGLGEDTAAPTVSSTVPANLGTGVAINASITATFSEGMDPLTISATTFLLMQGSTAIPATVTYAGTAALLNPTSDLTPSTVYTATITTGVMDLAGNAMAVDKVWTFTTGTNADSTAPLVVFTVPASNATGASINANITATFNESMNPATFTTATFTLKQGTTSIPATVSFSGLVATLNPTADLSGNTLYTAAITTGVMDLAGNALEVVKTWTFTTGTGPDTIPPTVVSTIPALSATGVALNANISATFSETMDVGTITTTTFTLKQGTTPIDGAVSYVGTVATFNPTSDLLASTVYTGTITTGAKDVAGNALAINHTWTFTTGTASAMGPAPIVLGTAGTFAILAEAGIDTKPTSVVNGDIGISPAAATYITGFSLDLVAGSAYATASQVTAPGKVYAPGYAPPTPDNLTTSVNNMHAAYVDADTRPTPDFLNYGAGDIAGETLVPGLYKWSAGLLATSDFTISGGPNDVWIFQITGNFNMSSTVKALLAGGANPKNIFWQCSGSFTLETTAHLEGIVLCKTAIDLKTGTTINGRLLSQTAVNIDQSIVTPPTE